MLVGGSLPSLDTRVLIVPPMINFPYIGHTRPKGPMKDHSRRSGADLAPVDR